MHSKNHLVLLRSSTLSYIRQYRSNGRRYTPDTTNNPSIVPIYGHTEAETSTEDVFDTALPKATVNAAKIAKPKTSSTTHHQRVLRWGIGNAFRSQSANRFTPVHAERPVEVTLPNNYYDSPHPSIQWEDLNESWEVYWYEHNKLNAKPFPIKKFGVDKAKREAIGYMLELEKKGRLNQEKPKHESPMEGVQWDEKMACWAIFGYEKGRPMTRLFSAEVHGYAKALELAIERKKRLKKQ